MAGTITLSESNSETSIKWKINHFSIRQDNLIISPDFVLFKSKWFLQIHLDRSFLLPFDNTSNTSYEYLRMSLLTLNPTTEYHIEYRMGIQVCNGSEITTEKFESVLKNGFNQTPQRRKIISRKDFESSRNTLVTDNTLTVFCTAHLMSAVNPDRDVIPPIPSTYNDLSSSLLLFCNERETTGDITLYESKNEIRIEWRLNDLSSDSYIIESPNCVFFNSKWFFRIRGLDTFIKSFSEIDTESDSSLAMTIVKYFPMHTECRIEYEMGIQMSDGSEIRTGKFEIILDTLFEDHRIIISRKDLKSLSGVLDSENAMNVFCTVRLLSDILPGDIDLLGNFSYTNSVGTLIGEITLNEAKNETRIEWKINHFFSRGNILMKSPDFKLFKSNWYLQISKCNVLPPFFLRSNSYNKSLFMHLQRDYYSTAEHHIEYRMGIKKPDGSEIKTETIASVFQPRFKKNISLRELISEEDLENLRHTLTHETTLKIFCTIRLLNAYKPVENAPSSISSTYDSGALHENSKNGSLAEGNSTSGRRAVRVVRRVTARVGRKSGNFESKTVNSEVPRVPKFGFNFSEQIKDSGALHENSNSCSLAEGSTLSENVECNTANSEVPRGFGFKFGEQCKGTGASYENTKSSSLTKGSFMLNENDKDAPLTKYNFTLNKNVEASELIKEIFKFDETFKVSDPNQEIDHVTPVIKSSPIFGSSLNEPNTIGSSDESDPSTSSESSEVCICKGNHTLSRNFEAFYRSKILTDVTITVKDKTFHAHKQVLSARSDVFASMFMHGTSEESSGVVEVADCDPDSFEDFLLYLYAGILDTVSPSNAASLYKTAVKYGMTELRDECVRCTSREMTMDSFCDIFHLAFLHGEADLLAAATSFFIRNASAILVTKEWMSLLKEHPLSCNELLVKFAKSGLQK